MKNSSNSKRKPKKLRLKKEVSIKTKIHQKRGKQTKPKTVDKRSKH
jgi:hypothetical protein